MLDPEQVQTLGNIAYAHYKRDEEFVDTVMVIRRKLKPEELGQIMEYMKVRAWLDPEVPDGAK